MLHSSLRSFTRFAVIAVIPSVLNAAGTSLKFQFGGANAAPGYTQVTPMSAYSDDVGYGFDGDVVLTAVTQDSANPLHGGAVFSDQPYSFSVAVPEGNYRITVTLGDPQAATDATVKAERRRLMLEHVTTAPGEFVTRSFLVNVRTPQISTGGEVQLNDRERDPTTGRINTKSWDDKLSIGFSGSHVALAALEVERVDDAITFFITGDSTVTDQSRGGSWGQMAPRWFGPGVVVANHAESGETLKGFLRFHRWDKVLDSMKSGDYVLIEFGTNDSKDHGPQNMYAGLDFAETHSVPGSTYDALLKQFVADVRARGGHPIIASPSARRGEVANPSSLGEYAMAAMATAAALDVPAINLNAMGMQLNAALGEDAALQFADRTHHSEYGAYLQAKCIVLGIRQAHLPLADYIVDDFGLFDPAHPRPLPSELSLPVDVPPRGRNR